MGTRNLTCVWIDGDFKVAQYGQWDGYPSGAGAEILSILKSINLEQMKENARKVTWADEEEIKKAWILAGANPDENWVTMDVSALFKSRHPEWDRDMGRKVLSILYQNDLRLRDERAFAADGLMCEWAYVVDLDAMNLEVYKGFNTESGKDHGKFANLPKVVYNGTNEYTPVVRIAVFPLNNLPNLEDFLKICNGREE